MAQNDLNFNVQCQNDNNSLASLNNPERYSSIDDNFLGVKLPTINLPNFSGSDWFQFKDTFDSLIVRNSKISSVQKFHYLKRALQGIQVTNGKFLIAWDLLCEQFTDKRALLHVHTKSLFSIELVRKESSKGLSQLVDHVKMHLCSLEALGEPTNSWDTLITYLLSTKLDAVTARDWESNGFSVEVPKLDDLISFLKQKSKMLNKWRIKILRHIQLRFQSYLPTQ